MDISYQTALDLGIRINKMSCFSPVSTISIGINGYQIIFEASKMLKMLYLGMMEVSSSFYGSNIGLAPISFASTSKEQPQKNNSFEESWSRDYDR